MRCGRITTHCSGFQVDFVAEDDKWEVFWVSRAGLDEELVPPTVECLERVGVCYIKHKYTAVGATIECHPQTLEPLLTCCIPDLEHGRTGMKIVVSAMILCQLLYPTM